MFSSTDHDLSFIPSSLQGSITLTNPPKEAPVKENTSVASVISELPEDDFSGFSFAPAPKNEPPTVPPAEPNEHPLMYAIRINDYEKFQQALSKAKDEELAAAYPATQIFYYYNYAKTDRNVRRFSPLTAATVLNRVEMVRALLKRNVDVDQLLPAEEVKLAFDAEYGSKLEELKAKAKEEAMLSRERTALWFACNQKDSPAELVKLLLDHRADPHYSLDSHTPLSVAVATNRTAIVDLLLQRSPHGVDVVTADGHTLFSHAAQANNTPMLRTLLKSLESLEKEYDLQKEEALKVIARSKEDGSLNQDAAENLLRDIKLNKDRMRDLLNIGPTEEDNDLSPLTSAVRNNNPDAVKLLLSQNNIRLSAKESTLMHMTAKLPNTDCAELLIEHIGDPEKVFEFVNTKNRAGTTPLFAAVTHDSVPMVKLLLSRKADVNAVKTEYRIGFMSELSSDSPALMPYLFVDRRGNYSLRGHHGSAPLKNRYIVESLNGRHSSSILHVPSDHFLWPLLTKYSPMTRSTSLLDVAFGPTHLQMIPARPKFKIFKMLLNTDVSPQILKDLRAKLCFDDQLLHEEKVKLAITVRNILHPTRGCDAPLATPCPGPNDYKNVKKLDKRFHQNARVLDTVIACDESLTVLNSGTFAKIQNELQLLDMQSLVKFPNRYAPLCIADRIGDNSNLSAAQKILVFNTYSQLYYHELGQRYQLQANRLQEKKAISEEANLRKLSKGCEEKSAQFKTILTELSNQGESTPRAESQEKKNPTPVALITTTEKKQTNSVRSPASDDNYRLAKEVLEIIKQRIQCINDIIPHTELPVLYTRDFKKHEDQYGQRFKDYLDYQIKLNIIRPLTHRLAAQQKMPSPSFTAYLATGAFGRGECAENTYAAIWELLKRNRKHDITALIVTGPNNAFHTFALVGTNLEGLNSIRSLHDLETLPNHCVILDPMLNVVCQANQYAANERLVRYYETFKMDRIRHANGFDAITPEIMQQMESNHRRLFMEVRQTIGNTSHSNLIRYSLYKASESKASEISRARLAMRPNGIDKNP